jgi:hypothetical protein
MARTLKHDADQNRRALILQLAEQMANSKGDVGLSEAEWQELAEAIAETQRALAAATETTDGATDDEAEAIKATLSALLAMLQQAQETLAGGMRAAQASKDHVTNYSGRL